jgi:8-oxo-dGTP pyrophosphatase MutT (NUDIX family)
VIHGSVGRAMGRRSTSRKTRKPAKPAKALARKPVIKRSAGLLLTSDGHVLLLRRSRHMNNAGLWGLPGGQRDAGERAWQTAWREACEEMGPPPPASVRGRLTVERGEALRRRSGRKAASKRRDRRRRASKRYDVFVCDAGRRAHKRYEPHLNAEHDAWQWVSLAWCIAHRDALHPVLRALLDTPLGVDALARELSGRGKGVRDVVGRRCATERAALRVRRPRVRKAA